MHFDILIVGAGVGGSATALALAPTGKTIGLLDRGRPIPRERANWDADRVFGPEQRYSTDERWTDGQTGDDFRASMYYGPGGNTKVYGSALLRMRERDFDETAHLEGVAPGWPISYADLAPYYDEAERLYHVHGLRGSDPFEPAADGPFPHPPIAHDHSIAAVAEGLAEAGLRPMYLPMGVKMTDERPGDGPFLLREMYAQFGRDAFDGFPDPFHLKADAEVATVQPATAHDNVELVTGCRVRRIVADGRTVTGVEAEMDDGERVSITADLVVLSAGAVNSAALLLASAQAGHEDGLANSSGRVGRHFMRHVTSKFYTVNYGRENRTTFQKTLALNDFYFGAPGDGPFDGVPLGHVHLMGKHTGPMIRRDLGPDHMTEDEAARIALHSVDWWVQGEDLPLYDNRVDLGPDGGIRLHYTPTGLAAHDRLMDHLQMRLEEIGFSEFHRVPMPLRVVNHQCGTCRMGTDPADSVLDTACRAHDLDNLYVVDASFFPSSGATNPTLTIAANALRVADRIVSGG
jgi:choline dehydrogenase-like flavoprotein